VAGITLSGIRRPGALALSAATVVALAACSPATGNRGIQATTTPTASTVDITPTAAPPDCTIVHLAVVAQHGAAASGHRSMVLVFTNHGPVCRLFGYPGVAALNSGGAQTEQAVRTASGYLGGLAAGQRPASAYLTNGESASAIVEAMAFTPIGDACTSYAGLLVTPPNETHSVNLPWDNDGCASLQIHPVVLGATGQGR